MLGSARYRTAIAAQLAFLVYFELCVLIPLGGWNAQPGNEVPFSSGNLKLGAIIGIPQLLLLIGTFWRVKLLLWLGLVGDTIWLALHIWSLWIPYFVGASPQYARMYARVFGHTTKLLPNFGNHLAPDAMHIFIDVFLAIVLGTLIAYMKGLGATNRKAGFFSAKQNAPDSI